MLKITFSLPDSALPGEPIMLTLAITNTGPVPLSVLCWYTPLEGPLSPFVAVAGPSGPLDYQGPMIKRGQPDDDDYLSLAPGQCHSVQVDLALLFPFHQPGDYRVSYRGPWQSRERGPEQVLVSPPVRSLRLLESA
ncbi:hypothetical protein [Gallaecimonas sp. GXIMD4217]|uniref:hypothetical protein n=1 Tax=Gallaecimonas sp. GXIMD4217 TaxID=3131927 RepID=UPI00311AEF52